MIERSFTSMKSPEAFTLEEIKQHWPDFLLWCLDSGIDTTDEAKWKPRWLVWYDGYKKASENAIRQS